MCFKMNLTTHFVAAAREKMDIRAAGWAWSFHCRRIPHNITTSPMFYQKPMAQYLHVKKLFERTGKEILCCKKNEGKELVRAEDFWPVLTITGALPEFKLNQELFRS